MGRYDYGLRGPHDTVAPRSIPRQFREVADGFEGRGRRSRPRPNRVTAAYDAGYVRDRGPTHTGNPHPFGDASGRIDDGNGYRRPYITRGGTWTGRGTHAPIRYDRRDYEPAYGGRYPDEL